MSDAQLRTLERRAQTSGAPADAGAWRAAQLRAGDLSRSQLSLLAYLGDPGALATLGLPSPPGEVALEEAILWLRGLSAWGDEVLYRGIFAWLQHAARAGPPAMLAAFQRAADDLSTVDPFTLRRAHGDQQRYRLLASHSSWLVLEAQQPDRPRTTALTSVLDRMFEDAERDALELPPPRAFVRARLDRLSARLVRPGVEALGEAREATPAHQRRFRRHFAEHGPGTYRIVKGDHDGHEFVGFCGFQAARVAEGCFVTFRDLADATEFSYQGPGQPDGWSVSP